MKRQRDGREIGVVDLKPCPWAKTHTFRGAKFRIFHSDADPETLGGSTSRADSRRVLFIQSTLRRSLLAETLVHEALHACFDGKLTEREVTQAARDITRLLGRVPPELYA